MEKSQPGTAYATDRRPVRCAAALRIVKAVKAARQPGGAEGQLPLPVRAMEYPWYSAEEVQKVLDGSRQADLARKLVSSRPPGCLPRVEVISDMNVLMYEVIYRIIQLFNVPISRVFGPHEQLQKIIVEVAPPPGHALELGCGNGRDAIFLAQTGFDVTAVDFSPTAIRIARENAQRAGVKVNFVQDDVTELSQATGTFDLIIDIGAFNDLSLASRDLYIKRVVPLTHVGSRFILMCFEKKLGVEEIEARFNDHFKVEVLEGDSGGPLFPGVRLFSMLRI